MNIRQISFVAAVAVISVIATLLSLSFFSFFEDTTKPKKSKEIVIEYGLDDPVNPTELVITAPLKDNCNDDDLTGCFKIKKSKTGLIKFEFTAAPEWQLRQFTICQGTAKITTICSADLTLDEQLEFFVMDDDTGTTILLTPKSGQVSLAALPAGAALREFYLFDQNTIRQDYFYNIEACNSDTGDCITLDPPVENKGRK